MKIFISILVVLGISLGGFFMLNNYIYQEKQAPSDFKEVTFRIDGEPTQLRATSTLTYFGNELEHDIDGDGAADTVFLIRQETEGSGTFFYLVGALNRDGRYFGTDAVFIGDRIAPQTTNKGEGREVIVNYADRAPGEPFTTAPSVGKSLYFLLNIETLAFEKEQ